LNYCARIAVANTLVTITDNKLFYENLTYTDYFKAEKQNTQIK